MDGEYACGLLILSMSMSTSLYRNWYLRMGSTPRTYILIVSISISISMSIYRSKVYKGREYAYNSFLLKLILMLMLILTISI